MNIGHVRKNITDRQNDSAGKQALSPASSTGEIELTDADLGVIYGGSFIKGLENPLVHLLISGRQPKTAEHMDLENSDNN